MTVLTSQSSLLAAGPASHQAAAPMSSLLINAPQRWWMPLIGEVQRLLASRPVDPQALLDSLEWLGGVPSSMPQPYLGVGDDGSVSVEWDRADNVLHVRFEAHGADAYFSGSNGDEFETSLDAGEDKIRAALQALARS